MALSVVIATYNDPLGLYMTFFAMWMQLLSSPISEWEIVIAADNGSDYKWEKYPNVRCLRLTGGNRTGSPQGTRDAGIRAAKYETVLCIESHVAVSNVYEWLSRHHKECGNPALSFCPRIGEGPEMYNVWGSTTNWKGNLWYEKHIYEPKPGEHRIVQFGHSAFMVNRPWYLDSGGYTDLQKGWGGEEPFLCLKAWMLGNECWMVPQVAQAHFLTPGAHADDQTQTRFTRNFDIVRYVMDGIMPTGREFSVDLPILEERRRIEAGPFGGSLQALQDYLKKEKVIN